MLELVLWSHSRPAALRVRVPPQAPGHSPAARAGLTVADLERLIDIVPGRS